MKKNKPALKPCPFCGGKAFLDSEFFGVYCNCGAELTFCESDKEAAEKWNIRPIEESLEEENSRLRDALNTILDATQKEKISIPVLRFVAYTALKGEEK